AVREPPHGRLWRQPRESRPFRARGAARGEGGGSRDAGCLPAVGRGFLQGRITVWRRPPDRGLGGGRGGGRVARHRRPLSLLAVSPDRAPTDDLSARDLSRL